MYDWLPIAEQLASNYTIILYHRPGYGKSELGDAPRTTEQVTKELHALLYELAIYQPIILVGHSYGGLCAQHFAMLYPNQLQALILVDSTSMNLHRLDALDLPISDQTDSDEIWLQKYKSYSHMDPEALYTELQSTFINKQKQYIEFSRSPLLYKASASELSEWKNCARLIQRFNVTLQIPLIIIGRDPNYSITQMIKGGMPIEEAMKLENMWQELIQEQLDLSINSKYILAKHAGHGVESERSDIIIETIYSLQEI
ncbi:alpha/beta hydrolase fold family protein [Bacillus clarus]|uniref:Alpha/beta hydrolase fold family protein n=1 Tax=Bacillus clarus TaxID=2338372 RepID=A0A090Z0F0_9BACI|nr:alpha/beta hydrolase fold family protein [Bacillus clarus]